MGKSVLFFLEVSELSIEMLVRFKYYINGTIMFSNKSMKSWVVKAVVLDQP